MEYINIPNVSVTIIIIVFVVFLLQAHKVRRLCKLIEKTNNSDDILGALSNTKLSALKEAYEKSICIEITGKKQTNTLAFEFFSEFSTCNAQRINLRLLDTASGTLVGLGLLGTFLGLTIGIKDFDSTSTQTIQKSIEMLLGGMGTAFLTSLVGMSLSIIYTVFDKFWRNRLSKHIYVLTNKLDSIYYIDDRTLDNLNEEALANSILLSIRELVQNEIRIVVDTLNNKLTYQNSEGETVILGNAIREILSENIQQSTALRSFSTDLALELNNGFDETLSRQMQQKILPLMENVDTTTKAIVEHIDKMAEQVSSPATEMIQSVVDELKNSMTSIIKEFSTGLSGSATNELENLASQLGTAAQAMADFPNNMANISSTLQVTIEEVKSAVSEISNTSANANSTAMQQMQEQITFATGAISNAISEVKEVMGTITQTSQQQSNEMANKLVDAAEKMGTFLNGTISRLSASVQESIENITTDVNNKQADLISLQEDTTAQTRKLLETFNVGLERLEKMNEYIAETMNMFQQAQGQISGSTAHLQTITGDMKLATQLFNRSQAEYSTKMEEMQRNSQRGIDSLTALLNNTGEMSNDYVEKFEIIKQGLGSIFAQLQQGLSEYSRTVQATTQRYLDQYSTSLTNTTDALSSTIQQQNEVVEMLVESLNSHKR
jgi:hypothetical protein